MIERTLALTFAVVIFGTEAGAQGGAPGPSSGKRYLIARGPNEFVPPPDILILDDGSRIEAHFLAFYGERAVYFVEEGDRFWTRREVPRARVTLVERGQYLERDPLEPLSIRKSTKQPVPKREVLSGVFTGLQGRHTHWRIAFHSELNKLSDSAEDATELGRFHLRSTFEKTAGERFSHEVLATGNYHLYAPGTVRNEDWLLVLTDIVESDRNHAPEQSYSTRTLPYEALMVSFSPDQETFRLAWSTIGESAWAAITQVEFRRLPSAPRAWLPGGTTLPDGRVERAEHDRLLIRARGGPSGSGDGSARPPGGSRLGATRRLESRIGREGWGPPPSRWGTRA